MAILRGDVYWAELDPAVGVEQAGRRPALILSETVFNARSGAVIVVPLTSREPKAAFPLTLEIIGSGFSKRSWAKISQIRTISTLRLGKKLGEATAEETALVLEGLNEILGA